MAYGRRERNTASEFRWEGVHFVVCRFAALSLPPSDFKLQRILRPSDMMSASEGEKVDVVREVA